MRRDVEFDAGGTTLRGWLYVPDRGDRPFPVVVMAHGFSALKEMGLDDYAEVFCAAGLAVLVYDHRNLGASDGSPRDEIDPIAQLRDYGHAVTFASLQREVDAQRIGLWGTSYSGGLVLIASAIDRRVRCVVSQVPYLSGYENATRTTSPERLADIERLLQAERLSLASGRAPTMVRVCTDDPALPEDSPGRMSFRYFRHFADARGLDWPNRVTLRSLDLRMQYEALPYLPRVAPTPLLMIVSEQDRITPTDVALRAFADAREPKKLLTIPGDHYRPYVEAFVESSTAARDWFVAHLMPDENATPA
jgi:dienelactone hydrolase